MGQQTSGALSDGGYITCATKKHPRTCPNERRLLHSRMSRTKAMQNITREEMRSLLKEQDVTLIGGGLDEAPAAYKDIRVVMAAQAELVDIIATFSPRMVRMADDGSRED